MRNTFEIYSGNRVPTWNVWRDLDDVFERAFLNPWSIATAAREPDRRQVNTGVEETENAFLLTVDVPGVRREDIHIDLKEKVLTVSGARKRELNVEQIHRSFRLPVTVDADRIEANLEDGVLSIALPKSEATKPRSIEIQSGKSGFLKHAAAPEST